MNLDYPVKVVRSRRKTLSAQIDKGTVLVKVPVRTSEEQILTFLQAHDRWIRRHLERDAQTREEAALEGILNDAQIRALAEQAVQVIPPKAAAYARRIGVSPGRITIRNQRTRWGSCSAKGNLNFNCLLMLCPDEVIDSVVVHELAHLTEMNHSPRFYAIVYAAFPDYDRWNRWLKEHGPALIRRMPRT